MAISHLQCDYNGYKLNGSQPIINIVIVYCMLEAGFEAILPVPGSYFRYVYMSSIAIGKLTYLFSSMTSTPTTSTFNGKHDDVSNIKV